MNSEVFRFKLGRFDCTIVNDGTYIYQKPGKVLFENVPHDAVVAALNVYDAVAEGMLVFAPHFIFPSLGRVGSRRWSVTDEPGRRARNSVGLVV
jgi:hypothetical protein